MPIPAPDAILKLTTVLAIAIPVAFEEVRVRLRNAETTPNLFLPTVLITALLLGDEKVPIPTPNKIIPHATTQREESLSKFEKINIANVDTASPNKAGAWVPILSEIHPPTGLIKAIDIELGTIKRPALAEERSII